MTLRYEIAIAEQQSNGTDISTELTYQIEHSLDYQEDNRYTLENYATQIISSKGILSNRGENNIPFVHINIYDGENLYGRYIANVVDVGEGKNTSAVITGWVYYTVNKKTKKLEKFVAKSLLNPTSIIMYVYSTLIALLIVFYIPFNGNKFYDFVVAVNNFSMVIFIIFQFLYLDAARKEYYKRVKHTPKRVMIFANAPVLGTSLLALLGSGIPLWAEVVSIVIGIVVMVIYLVVLIHDEKQATKL